MHMFTMPEDNFNELNMDKQAVRHLILKHRKCVQRLEKLEKYDIWLAQDGEKPDYPYQFGMWQYDSDGSIKGISGDVAMSISFVDYAK